MFSLFLVGTILKAKGAGIGFAVALSIPYGVLLFEILHTGWLKITHEMVRLETYIWLAETLEEDRQLEVEELDLQDIIAIKQDFDPLFVGYSNHIPHID